MIAGDEERGQQETSTTSLCGVDTGTTARRQGCFVLTRNQTIALVCLGVIVVVGVGVGIYFGVSGDSSSSDTGDEYASIPVPSLSPEATQPPANECSFSVCGECYATLQDAATQSPCDGEEDLVVQVLVDEYLVYEPIVLESSSLILSGENHVSEGNSVPVIAAAFSGQERGLIECAASTSIQLSLKSLSFNGNGQIVSAARSRTSSSVDFSGEQVSFTNFRSANGVHGAVLYFEQVGNFKLDSQSSASDNVAGDSDSGCPETGGFNSEYCGGCTGYYGGAPIYLETVSGVMQIDGEYRNNTNYFNHGQGGVFFFGMVNGAGSTITGLFEGNKATEGGVLVADTVDCDGELTLTGTYTNNAAEDFYGHCGSRGGAITVRRVDGGTTVTIDGTFENNIGGVFGGVLRNDRILNNARINLYGDFTDNTAEDGNIANMRVLASGSIFHFAPSNIDTISADDIQFSSDACTDTSTKENVITCEN